MGLMRRSLLMASQSPWLRERAPRYGFMRRTVKRFMPGENVGDALAAAQALASTGIGSVLTHLGENITDGAEAQEVTKHYLHVLDQIRNANLPAEVSVKLTQLGLDLDQEFCSANLAKLIEHTPPEKTLWIDIEQSPYVDVTLELYRRARKAHPNVGVCVQAYLHRTEKDLDSLISIAASVRLVKGAYNEPAEIAFPLKKDVDENYFRLAQKLLGPEAEETRLRVAIATHDRVLIAKLIDSAASQGVAKNRLEFQMLYGIQRAEQLRLAREGFL